MQCQLRSVPNFIPSRQHAVNPLSSSMSQGPRAALSVPEPLSPAAVARSASVPGSSHRRGWRDARSEAPGAALTLAGGGRAAAPPVLAGAAGCGGRRCGLCGAPGCGPAPRGAPSNQRAPAAWPGARPGRVRDSRGARAAARHPSRFRARCLDAVAVAARAGGFPRAPAPSPAAPPLLPPRSHTRNSLSASPRSVPELPARQPGAGGRGFLLLEKKARWRAGRLEGRRVEMVPDEDQSQGGCAVTLSEAVTSLTHESFSPLPAPGISPHASKLGEVVY